MASGGNVVVRDSFRRWSTRPSDSVFVDHERIASRFLFHRFAHLGQLVACRAEPLLCLQFSASIRMMGHAHLPETLANDILRKLLDGGDVWLHCPALRAPRELLMNGNGGQQHIAVARVMLLGIQMEPIPKGGKKSVGDLPQGVAGVFAVTDFYPAHGITSIVSECVQSEMRRSRAMHAAFSEAARIASRLCPTGQGFGERAEDRSLVRRESGLWLRARLRVSSAHDFRFDEPFEIRVD
jgi:hypothetical protein